MVKLHRSIFIFNHGSTCLHSEETQKDTRINNTYFYATFLTNQRFFKISLSLHDSIHSKVHQKFSDVSNILFKLLVLT